MFFTISKGLINTFEIFDKMKSYDSIANGGTEIPVFYGFKVLVFGVISGTVNYLGGLLFRKYKEEFFKLISLTPLEYMKTYKTSTITSISASGSQTFTKIYK